MLEFFGQRDENFGSGRPDRPTPAALSAAKNLELGRRDAVLFPCRAATTLSVHNSGGLFRPYQALHRIKCPCVTNGRRFHVTLIRESEYKKKHGFCGEYIGYRPLESTVTIGTYEDGRSIIPVQSCDYLVGSQKRKTVKRGPKPWVLRPSN